MTQSWKTRTRSSTANPNKKPKADRNSSTPPCTNNDSTLKSRSTSTAPSSTIIVERRTPTRVKQLNNKDSPKPKRKKQTFQRNIIRVICVHVKTLLETYTNLDDANNKVASQWAEEQSTGNMDHVKDVEEDGRIWWAALDKDALRLKKVELELRGIRGKKYS
ncbi:hypothetical protein ONS95_003842 [Cadophora gregata]|uniref:uncharacterized protein n=1 Tax=Cadophora gregata TaxID=51156 RepID=UPI0026DB34B6|nr:uncharacterized protein ONS95_003842 [Cadophora gregata]KAK0107136.1 hypothetical protein ONS95_003842 [Cadophora gregata]